MAGRPTCSRTSGSRLYVVRALNPQRTGATGFTRANQAPPPLIVGQNQVPFHPDPNLPSLWYAHSPTQLAVPITLSVADAKTMAELTLIVSYTAS